MTPEHGDSGFWQFNLGHLLTICALLISFWSAHRSNVKRIKQSSAEFERVRVKVDLIFRWFENNVVGRGETPRAKASGEGLSLGSLGETD